MGGRRRSAWGTPWRSCAGAWSISSAASCGSLGTCLTCTAWTWGGWNGGRYRWAAQCPTGASTIRSARMAARSTSLEAPSRASPLASSTRSPRTSTGGSGLRPRASLRILAPRTAQRWCATKCLSLAASASTARWATSSFSTRAPARGAGREPQRHRAPAATTRRPLSTAASSYSEVPTAAPSTAIVRCWTPSRARPPRLCRRRLDEPGLMKTPRREQRC